jgi:hypothetical protein
MDWLAVQRRHPGGVRSLWTARACAVAVATGRFGPFLRHCRDVGRSAMSRNSRRRRADRCYVAAGDRRRWVARGCTQAPGWDRRVVRRWPAPAQGSYPRRPSAAGGSVAPGGVRRFRADGSAGRQFQVSPVPPGPARNPWATTAPWASYADLVDAAEAAKVGADVPLDRVEVGEAGADVGGHGVHRVDGGAADQIAVAAHGHVQHPQAGGDAGGGVRILEAARHVRLQVGA